MQSKDYPQRLEDLRKVIAEELAKVSQMNQSTHSPELSKDLIQEAMTESFVELFGESPDEEHGACENEDCEGCRSRDDGLIKQGAAQSAECYEKIPGVTGCREKWAEAKQTLSISQN